MKKIILRLAGIAILGICCLSPLSAAEQPSNANVLQLMDKSGITRAIESLPLQMQAMGQQMALTAKDPAEHQAFIQMFLSSLDTDAVTDQIREYLQQQLNATETQAMLNWLDSELAGKVVKAELQSTEPEFQQNLIRYIADLQATPPSPERTQAVINYVEATGMADQAMKMIGAIVGNMFSAMKAKDPENSELATTLDTQLEQMETMMKPGIEQQMVLTSYYVYRDISIADLNEYAAFYQQPLGEKFLSSIFEALGVAMSQWGSNLVDQITANKK